METSRNHSAGPVPWWKRWSLRLRAFVRDDNGATAIIAAILMPVLLGGMGVGAEAGYWYMAQRRLQHAADVSAYAAAVRIGAGDTQDGIVAAATDVARKSGFVPSGGTITVTTPPQDGLFAGNPSSAEVLLSQTIPRLFSAIFIKEPLIIGARAVARVQPLAEGCVLALAPAAGGAVRIPGTANVTVSGCEIASNSRAPDAVLVDSDGQLTTDCMESVGTVSARGSLTVYCSAPHEDATPVLDPYLALPKPDATGLECLDPQVGDATVLMPMPNADGVDALHFCNGMRITESLSHPLPAGLYIVEGGDLAIPAGVSVDGTGVTFYLATGARLAVDGSATVRLSASSSGPYAGMLFFGARDNAGAENSIDGAPGSSFDGVTYFPASAVTYRASGILIGCLQIVALSVVLDGSWQSYSPCSAEGARPIVAARAARLGE